MAAMGAPPGNDICPASTRSPCKHTAWYLAVLSQRHHGPLGVVALLAGASERDDQAWYGRRRDDSVRGHLYSYPPKEPERSIRPMRIPTIHDIKPRFQACLRPLAGRLAGWGFTANQVTVAAVVISLLAGLAVALCPEKRWPLLAIPLVLFVRMALNAIDGMLAREFGMRSALGGILNELGDVFSDAFLYLPFAVPMPGVASWIYAFVLLAVIGEMAGVVGVSIGASRRYDGPLGKSDRAFAIGLLALLVGLGVPQGGWVGGYWVTLCILAVATIGQRGRAALREVAR